MSSRHKKSVIQSVRRSLLAVPLVLGLWQASAQTYSYGQTLALSTDKACYQPGSTVTFTASGIIPASGTATLRYRHHGALISEQTFAPDANNQWTWTPPPTDYQGYMVDVYTRDASGREQELGSIAVDVSSDWKRYPRYGFVGNYDDNGNAAKKTAAILTEMAYLNRLHINGVQFYDWQWKHHQPVKFTGDGSLDPWYQDISNRWTGVAHIKKYIEVQHQYGMKSMFYNLCFGAWKDADKDGVNAEWGLYKKGADGTLTQDCHELPSSWQSNIYLENPGNPGWQNYIADRNDEVYANYDFDGYHIDQLGGRGDLYAYNGDNIDLTLNYGYFINAMKTRRPDKRLVMNAVGGYGADQIDSKDVDFCYNEMWDGQKNFSDLYDAIRSNDAVSGNARRTVFAAYMDYDKQSGNFNTHGVLMTDAVIAAIGGFHLEMGDHMLSSEYFPNDKLPMSETLKRRLVAYYDFQVAYENLLRGSASTHDFTPEVSISSGQAVSAWPPKANTITTFGKREGNSEVIHFLNFLNTDDLSWRDKTGTRPEPQVQTDVAVSVKASRPVRKVWVASPDFNGGVAQDVPFTQNDGVVSFTLPSVEYWTMAVLEECEDNVYITGEAVKADDKEAYDLSAAISMIPSENGKVFKASVYLKGGEPFKFVNGVDWGSCQSYNAEYSDYEFNDQINTANLIFANSSDYKFKVKESGNYDITLNMGKGTIEVDKSSFQTTAFDRYPALFVIGINNDWTLSKAVPLTEASPSRPYLLAACAEGSRNATFKFATRRVDNDWGQVFGIKGSTDEEVAFEANNDSKWTIPDDGYYYITYNRLTKQMTFSSSATVTLGSTGYATYCVGAPVDFSAVAGLTAYIASDVKDGKVTMTPVAKASAGTGLILKGSAGATYTLPFCEDDGTVKTNLLVGVTEATAIEPTANGNENYIFADGTSGVGFYPASAGTLAANKAYLSVPASAAAKGMLGMSLSDATTSVKNVLDAKAGTTDAMWYTLTGQRVNKPSAGVYIHGGRKVIIK